MAKCNNPKCTASTGIHGGMTFGSGRLNYNGYWEFPCRICAVDFDQNVEAIRDKLCQELLEAGNLPLVVAQAIAEQDWLYILAWPWEHTDIPGKTREIQQQLDEEEARWAEFDRVNEEYF